MKRPYSFFVIRQSMLICRCSFVEGLLGVLHLFGGSGDRPTVDSLAAISRSRELDGPLCVPVGYLPCSLYCELGVSIVHGGSLPTQLGRLHLRFHSDLPLHRFLLLFLPKVRHLFRLVMVWSTFSSLIWLFPSHCHQHQ